MVELFRNRLVRHSAVLYRNNSPDDSQPVNFIVGDWLDYVPIHLPDTICVQKRLPPGAAAVLINQSDTFKDLFMIINPIEKRWYEMIDGAGRFDDSVKKNLLSTQKSTYLDMAHTFFERSWWYNQVVFDAS